MWWYWWLFASAPLHASSPGSRLYEHVLFHWSKQKLSQAYFTMTLNILLLSIKWSQLSVTSNKTKTWIKFCSFSISFIIQFHFFAHLPEQQSRYPQPLSGNDYLLSKFDWIKNRNIRNQTIFHRSIIFCWQHSHNDIINGPKRESKRWRLNGESINKNM